MAADWPALMTIGVATPEMLKGAPLMLMSEIVKSAAPAFDRVMVEEVLLPTVALPASNAAGLTTSCGWGAAALAETLICADFVSVAAGWKLRVAAVLPGVAPLNHTTKFAVWPAARVSGKVNPEIAN